MAESGGTRAWGLTVVRSAHLAALTSLGAAAVALFFWVVVFWDEMLLAVPIILLVKSLGFWPAYVVFVLIWTAMNVISLTLFDLVWLKVRPHLQVFWLRVRQAFGLAVAPINESHEEPMSAKSWRVRAVLWSTNLFRPLGAAATGLLLGGPLGAPMYRFLGYRGLSGYLWTIALCPIYGIIWVSFYGAGGVKVIDLVMGAF